MSHRLSVAGAVAVLSFVVPARGPAQTAAPSGAGWVASIGLDPTRAGEWPNPEENFVAALGRQWSRSNSGLGFRAQLSIGTEPSQTTLFDRNGCPECSVRRSRSLAELSGAAVYTFRRSQTLRPYLLGGPALYSVRTSYDLNGLVSGDPNGQNPSTAQFWSLGATIGAGASFRILGREFLVEQRLLLPDLTTGRRDGFVVRPLSIGIKF